MNKQSKSVSALGRVRRMGGLEGGGCKAAIGKHGGRNGQIGCFQAGQVVDLGYSVICPRLWKRALRRTQAENDTE